MKTTLKILFICFLGLTNSMLFAQKAKIYGILLADSEEALNGKSHVLNLTRINAELDTAAAFSNMEKEIQVFQGKDLTWGKLEGAIKDLKLSENDVLFFYFSGNEHIGRSRSTDGHLLQLDTAISLKHINNLLEMKKPRFLFVFADLCNKYFERGNFILKVEPASPERYASLFAQTKGKIFAVNHLPREQADIFITSNGSAFTNAIIQAIHEPINPQAKWETVFARARFFSIRSSNGNQNPQCEVNVTQDIKSGGYNFHADDKLTTNDIKFNPQIEEKKNGKAKDKKSSDNVVDAYENEAKKGSSASSNGKFMETVVPAYENPVKVLVLDPSNPESLRQGSLQRIEMLQETLANLAGSKDNNMIEKVMELFKDNVTNVEVSHLRRGKSRMKAKKYLGKLMDSGKSNSMNISWYKPTEIGEVVPDGNGGFKTTAMVFQEFRRTSKSGKLLYGDRTSKKIEVLLQKINEEWKVMIGDIEVIETLPIPNENGTEE